MKNIIKELYKIDRQLLGSGYNNALEYLKHLLDLEILEFKSGTKIGTWEVPKEWVIRDAWVKHRGKKIIDYKKESLSILNYSIPFKGKISGEELRNHLYISHTNEKATPYEYTFYKKEWGFCVPRVQFVRGYKPFKTKRKVFEVLIDTEFKNGIMKLGIHTIKGKSNKEILLFAHLDHPFQANDNASGVACLVDLAHKIKKDYKLDHTIKIIFCPETIGSIAYALTQDISKVDFMIAVDAIGNDDSLLIQKSFDEGKEINWAIQLAASGMGENYKFGKFRMMIGSDEYVFNDPKIGIPGIMLSRWSEEWKDYHTSADTPDKIKIDKIKKVQDVILKTIEIMEANYIPRLKFKGPLMRSRFGVQTFSKQHNRQQDYFIYMIDGKKSLLELATASGLGWQFCWDLLEKLKDEHLCVDISKK